MGQIARCYISPIEPGHPDTCHIRDFSGSLRLPASLTNIHGESCGGPSLAPSDESKYFPCESQWQLFLYPDLLDHDHAECCQTRTRKPYPFLPTVTNCHGNKQIFPTPQARFSAEYQHGNRDAWEH